MVAQLNTWLTRTVGVKYPFVQGGMQWVGTADLVAAVANAGALGFITAFTFPDPEALRAEIRKCKSLANGHPFGVNLTLLPTIRAPDYVGFAQVCVDEGVRIFETAGNPKPVLPVLAKAKDAIIIHKCVGIAHALKAQKAGASAISIDGFECAGHPGEDGIGTMVLLARALQVLDIPVIASGGFADARGIAAALAMGAQGINMGTRWLCTQEAPIHENVKKAIVAARETDTAVLLKPLNNSVRCYRNGVAKQVLAEEAKPGFEFPRVASLMSGIRGRLVYSEGDPEAGIWSLGQSAGLIQDIPTCRDLVVRLNREAIELLQRSTTLIERVAL